MNKKDLKLIEEALKKSPNNIALRLTYALKLFKVKEWEQSEKNYHAVLKLDPSNTKAKQGLVELYFVKTNYSAVIVIAEELVKLNAASEKMMELYAKALLRQNSIADAQEVYERIIKNNPFYFDEELDSVLEDHDEYLEEGDEFDDEEDYGDDDMAGFFENPFFSDETHLFLPEANLHFDDLIGLDKVKALINFKTPILTPELPNQGSTKFALLLFGPPGCGKTYFVKALPKELDVSILPLGIDRLIDSFSYKAEGLLHFYFGKMRLNRPCVLWIDEVERYAVARTKEMSYESRQTVSKFLEELDGVRFKDESQFVIAATNEPWSMDSVFFTPGKFDYQMFVPPPSLDERKKYFMKMGKTLQIDEIKIITLAEATAFFSYPEMDQLIDHAFFNNLKPAKRRQKVKVEQVLAIVKSFEPYAKTWIEKFVEFTPSFMHNTQVYKEVMKYKSAHKL